MLEPIRWETHGRSEFGGHPQSILNKQIVEDCDMAIAMFWTRLGTPTDEYRSGTVEELERVLGAGKPAAAYFSTMATTSVASEVEQQRLHDYKTELFTRSLAFSFEGHEALRRLIRNDLETWMAEHTDALPTSTPTRRGTTLKDKRTRYKIELTALANRAKEVWLTVSEGRRNSKLELAMNVLTMLQTHLAVFRAKLPKGLEKLRGHVQSVMVGAGAAVLQYHRTGYTQASLFWDKGDEVIESLALTETLFKLL